MIDLISLSKYFGFDLDSFIDCMYLDRCLAKVLLTFGHEFSEYRLSKGKIWFF